MNGDAGVHNDASTTVMTCANRYCTRRVRNRVLVVSPTSASSSTSWRSRPHRRRYVSWRPVEPSLSMMGSEVVTLRGLVRADHLLRRTCRSSGTALPWRDSFLERLSTMVQIAHGEWSAGGTRCSRLSAKHFEAFPLGFTVGYNGSTTAHQPTLRV